MNPDATPPPGAALVPPRPNLGPEPLEPGPAWPFWLALIAAILLAAGFISRRRRRRVHPSSAIEASVEPVGSSSEILIGWADRARDVLAERFGPARRASTTEELADDAGLVEQLGPELTADLLALLRAADRAKFAPDLEPDPAPPTDPAALMGALAAGASSIKKGR